MTIDFLSGEITAEQHKASPELITNGSNTLKPGEYGFVPIEAIWADADDMLWLDATLGCDLDPNICLHDDIARVIRVDEGYIVDISHVDFSADERPFYRIAESEKDSAYKDSEPVIGLIIYPEEREMLAGMLQDRYGETDMLKPVKEQSTED